MTGTYTYFFNYWVCMQVSLTPFARVYIAKVDIYNQQVASLLAYLRCGKSCHCQFTPPSPLFFPDDYTTEQPPDSVQQMGILQESVDDLCSGSVYTATVYKCRLGYSFSCWHPRDVCVGNSELGMYLILKNFNLHLITLSVFSHSP